MVGSRHSSALFLFFAVYPKKDVMTHLPGHCPVEAFAAFCDGSA
jgi:hypothetical protein